MNGAIVSKEMFQNEILNLDKIEIYSWSIQLEKIVNSILIEK